MPGVLQQAEDQGEGKMEPTLHQAITAIKSGDKKTGGKLLAELILTNKKSEQAWLWMSCIVDHDDRRRDCLVRLLAINPSNQYARRELARTQPSNAPPSTLNQLPVTTRVTSQSPPMWKDQPNHKVHRFKVVKHSNDLRQKTIKAAVPQQIQPDPCQPEVQNASKIEDAPILKATVVEAASPSGTSNVPPQRTTSEKLFTRVATLPIPKLSKPLDIDVPHVDYHKDKTPPYVQFVVSFIAVCFLAVALLAWSDLNQTVAVASVSVVKNTPVPTPAPKTLHVDGTYSDLDSLIQNVIGARTEGFSVDIHLNSPSRKGYAVDAVIASPSTITRRELLQFAYVITHEFYHDFADRQPDYLTIRFRSSYDADACELAWGLGRNVTAKYLPLDPPSDLEQWFKTLVIAANYGDLPGQAQSFMAYGDDPVAQLTCRLDGWKHPEVSS